MRKFKKLSLTLALLITAVGGAWADETLLTTITATAKEQASYSTANVATVSFSYTEEGYSVYSDRWGWWGYGFTATVTAAEGYTITKCIFYDNDGASATDSTDPFIVETTEEDKTPKVNGATFGAFTSAGIKKIEVYGYVTPAEPTEPTVEVTTDAASEQDLFTEASFTMPAFDATAEYELVRDLSVETQVTVGDDHDAQPRYRVQKTGNVFHPVELTADQVKALFKVHDNIEDADLTATEDYTVEIYAIDDDGKTVGEPQTFATFTYAPGQYIVKAQGQGNYVGTTEQSNVFTLFQGYEIVVAANEYATYYKDEALYIEDEDAQLYTITAVGKETATATEVTTAAANMPILVKNNSTETKTILLIPTTDQTPDDVTAADEFLGTLTVKEFTADETSAASYYVCNGKEFVQVRGAGSLGANKAYLKVNGSAAVNAPRLVIGFGGEGTTGISEEVRVKNEEFATAPYYDLNGRKLQGKPTQKGVYIKNGKKVIVP